MKVFVGQIYIEPNVSYPFSIHFQQNVGRVLTEMLLPTSKFQQKFPGFDLIFRLSAKSELVVPEIKGPTVFRRDKQVEYSIFLPFESYSYNVSESFRRPLELFFYCVAEAADKLGIDAALLKSAVNDIISELISDSTTFDPSFRIEAM